MLRLPIEDVTLIKADQITAHVRLRGGATRTLTVDRPLPMAQIRKKPPPVVAEVDVLPNEHGDREVAEILHQRGHRTLQNQPFAVRKIGYTRRVYHLKGRFDRLREQGLLTAKQTSKALGVCETTVHNWAQSGLLRRFHCDRRHSLYEPLQGVRIIKGRDSSRSTAIKSEQGAI